ncbi:Scytalone dehydratase arp1 [Fusarium oxysporum f. sp. albedinis]|nr:Scytalone dehydratase arp1 [Fusarium oxysporum f. sp. albedinis]
MISFNHLIDPLVGYPASSALTASVPLLTELTGPQLWVPLAPDISTDYHHPPFHLHRITLPKGVRTCRT